MRKLETMRAEADKLEATQRQMAVETNQRRRGFGVDSLVGPLGIAGGGKRSLLGSN